MSDGILSPGQDRPSRQHAPQMHMKAESPQRSLSVIRRLSIGAIQRTACCLPVWRGPTTSVRIKHSRSLPGTFPCTSGDVDICSRPYLVDSCDCFVSHRLITFRTCTIWTISRRLVQVRVARSVTPTHSMDRQSTRVRPASWLTVDPLTSQSQFTPWGRTCVAIDEQRRHG